MGFAIGAIGHAGQKGREGRAVCGRPGLSLYAPQKPWGLALGWLWGCLVLRTPTHAAGLGLCRPNFHLSHRIQGKPDDEGGGGLSSRRLGGLCASFVDVSAPRPVTPPTCGHSRFPFSFLYLGPSAGCPPNRVPELETGMSKAQNGSCTLLLVQPWQGCRVHSQAGSVCWKAIHPPRNLQILLPIESSSRHISRIPSAAAVGMAVFRRCCLSRILFRQVPVQSGLPSSLGLILGPCSRPALSRHLRCKPSFWSLNQQTFADPRQGSRQKCMPRTPWAVAQQRGSRLQSVIHVSHWMPGLSRACLRAWW